MTIQKMLTHSGMPTPSLTNHSPDSLRKLTSLGCPDSDTAEVTVMGDWSLSSTPHTLKQKKSTIENEDKKAASEKRPQNNIRNRL